MSTTTTATTADALRHLADAVRDVTARGLVVSGELHVTAPRTPGLVRVVATIHDAGPTGRLDLRTQASGAASAPEPAPSAEPVVLKPGRVAALKNMGFTGNVCPHCGGTQLVRRGTCEYCSDCGSSNGCS